MSLGSLPAVVAMFAAPSLHFLEKLNFGLYSRPFPDATYQEGWVEPILSQIVLLSHLQTLELDMGLRTSWCKSLSKLKNLKSLICNCIDLEGPAIFSRERTSFGSYLREMS